jgi:hypothetical protein
LCLAVGALVFASCTTDEDTEPHVPSVPGATQPEGSGALLSEADACERARSAALDAYDRLGCDETFAECPAFLRPGGGSGCYEYREGSIEACEQAYEEASSCRNLGPCLVTAEQNLDLDTCEQITPDPGAGGAGGMGPGVGGTDTGGAAPLPIGGADPGTGGIPALGGSPSGGAGGSD